MKKLFLLLLSLITVSIIIGCSSNSGTTGGEKELADEQELSIVNQEIAPGLDPLIPQAAFHLRGIGVAEALFKVNAEGEVEPSLAEGINEVAAMKWEIQLRPDAKFWSGKAINAKAVIQSLEHSKEKDLLAKPYLDDLTFTEINEYTILVQASSPSISAPLNLSYYQTVIQNIEAKQDSVDTMDLTGMYKVAEFLPKQKIVLERNENYWGQKPKIKRVVVQEISDGQTRVQSALSGSSHIAINIPVTSVSQLKDQKLVETSVVPVANTLTIYTNQSRPQLKDVRVRQALSWAIDREELVLLATEGQSTPVSSWLGSNPKFPEAKSAVYPKYDSDRANQLLDEAGWLTQSDGIRYKDGTPLTIRIMTWGGEKATGETLQSQWAKVGVKAEVLHGDYSLITAAREKNDWDVCIEAWGTFGDIYTLLSSQFAPDGSANYGKFNDEQTNQLLQQLKETSDSNKAHELALQINERVAQLAPVISLYPRPQLTVVNKSVSGYKEHFRQFEYILNADMSLGNAESK
ncbi:ABC transporter substrate-binding protein [Paenibacillus solani]|uniref:ABC transporter substrate-binding protein n=1 Tax=Paenibacillus solani TaxID=1705565 RepID=UPI003D26DCF9